MSPERHHLPTPAELEILQVLWRRGPSTVREVHEQQKAERDVRYTTVLKLLQNLHDKGLVHRDDSERSHVFSAGVERDSVEARLVDRFVDSVFEGSATRLVLRALSTSQASDEELRAIRELAERLDTESS